MVATNNKYKKIIGQKGEDLAVRFLESLEYIIIDRNWKCKIGEIDIIATKDQDLFFIEVKTRSNINFGYPSEALNYKKMHRMHLTAEAAIKNLHYPKYSYQLALVSIINEQCELIILEQ